MAAGGQQPLPNLMGTQTFVIGEHEVAEELLVMHE